MYAYYDKALALRSAQCAAPGRAASADHENTIFLPCIRVLLSLYVSIASSENVKSVH